MRYRKDYEMKLCKNSYTMLEDFLDNMHFMLNKSIEKY